MRPRTMPLTCGNTEPADRTALALRLHNAALFGRAVDEYGSEA